MVVKIVWREANFNFSLNRRTAGWPAGHHGGAIGLAARRFANDTPLIEQR